MSRDNAVLLHASTKTKKAVKRNGGDSHILAGAGQTLLVNTEGIQQD